MCVIFARRSFKDSLKVLEADIQHANTLYGFFSPFSSAFYFWFYCLLSDVAWYFYVVYVFGLVIVQYLVVLILKGCSFFICSCCKIFELCWWYLNANLNSVYPCIPKFYVFLYGKWISEGSLVCRWALTGSFEGFVV